MSKEKLSKLQKEVIEKSNKNLNSKEQRKLEEKKKKLNIVSAKHAMYKTQKENVDAPFGKTIRAGGHKSKKDFNRAKEKFIKGKEY